MKHLLNAVAVACVMLSSGTAIGGEPASPARPPAEQVRPAVVLPGEWHLAYAEEFTGTEAGLDARWEFQNGPSGHVLCSRWRDNARLENGVLRLIARKESRGGQEWTAASGWTRREFRYGYFECRYRYLPSTGTNNSFWIMDRRPAGSDGKFEIDINEGRYPNEVNVNLHNWSGEHWSRGAKWYQGRGRALGPADAGFEFVLDPPVATGKLRFRSREATVRIMELRAFAPRAGGYPGVFPDGNERGPKVENLCRKARAAASSTLEAGYAAANAIDGRLGTGSRWISGREPGAELIVEFPARRRIGCIQFISGWEQDGAWQGIVHDFAIDYWDGKTWQPVPGANRRDLEKKSAAAGAPNLGRSFHVYSLRWTPDELTYYFDGKPVHRTKNDICHQPAPVWLSLAVVDWAGPVTDEIDGRSMDVDYVRVWQQKD